MKDREGAKGGLKRKLGGLPRRGVTLSGGSGKLAVGQDEFFLRIGVLENLANACD